MSEASFNMNATLYFNVYQHSQLSIFHREFPTVVLKEGIEGASPNHRTIVGPFMSQQEADANRERYDRAAGEDFVHSIAVPIDLGPAVGE